MLAADERGYPVDVDRVQHADDGERQVHLRAREGGRDAVRDHHRPRRPHEPDATADNCRLRRHEPRF